MKIEVKDISKKYYRPTKQSSHFEAVKKVSFSIETGKVTEVIGRSGSGKSTLLYMCSGLLKPSTGKVLLFEDSEANHSAVNEIVDLYSLKDKELSFLRNKNTGIIPQGQTGLFALTVLQNVLLPSAIYGKSDDFENRA